jgi:polyisoprenoid-binding protein YceI
METNEVATKTKWGFDYAHTEIAFNVKHLMIATVSGVFKDFGVTIQTKDEDFANTNIEFWVNPSTVMTGSEERDAHIKGADFFDVEKYRQITFRASTAENIFHKGKYKLPGDLTIKGISKKIELDVNFSGVITDPWGTRKAIFSIRGKIDRKDWGLNWNIAIDNGGVLVSEEVWIIGEVQLIKQLQQL